MGAVDEVVCPTITSVVGTRARHKCSGGARQAMTRGHVEPHDRALHVIACVDRCLLVPQVRKDVRRAIFARRWVLIVKLGGYLPSRRFGPPTARRGRRAATPQRARSRVVPSARDPDLQQRRTSRIRGASGGFVVGCACVRGGLSVTKMRSRTSCAAGARPIPMEWPDPIVWTTDTDENWSTACDAGRDIDIPALK